MVVVGIGMKPDMSLDIGWYTAAVAVDVLYGFDFFGRNGESPFVFFLPLVLKSYDVLGGVFEVIMLLELLAVSNPLKRCPFSSNK